MSTDPVSGVTIACVVEGYGEVDALPVLLRRLVMERISPGSPPPHVPHPHRIPKGSLKAGQLEKAVAAAGNRVLGAGGILVLVDADDDCPGTEGPEWLARARKARSDKPVAVVFAKREFEAWFLAGASSLAGKRGLSGLGRRAGGPPGRQRPGERGASAADKRSGTTRKGITNGKGADSRTR